MNLALEIKCKHKLAMSRCKACYPVFLEETTVGDYLDNPLNLSQDTIAQSLNNQMLQLSINQAATIIEFAAQVTCLGEVKKDQYRSIIKEFRRIHKAYNKRLEAIINEAEATYGW